jgi:SAM-dependent methyltransferase
VINSEHSPGDWDAHWHALGEGMKNNPGRNIRHEYILRIIQENQMHKILDYGAGDGQLVRKLTSHGLNVIGWEHSEIGVARATHESDLRGMKSKVIITPKDLEDYAGTFDLVIMSEVIEHLEKPKVELLPVLALLRSGGCFIATVPSGPMSYFDRHIGHFRHYSPDSFQKLLAICGLTQVKVVSIGFPLVNVVRIISLILGKRMLSFVTHSDQDSWVSKMATLMEKLLFRPSIKTNVLGWQLIGVARKI